MTFIHDDFLLQTDHARHLYHTYAADQPILDYHCHLSPADLANNRQFGNLFDIWLAGDHYKWRAMRLNGEDEALCTGDADPYDKFLAFARTVPHTLRNPLFHWTHLELKRYFGIDELLNEQTAPAIWEAANAQLAEPRRSAWGIVEQFRVELIGTTDDPTDDLEHHQALKSRDCPARVVPTFRPDPAMKLGDLTAWNAWMDKLAAASGQACDDLDGCCAALAQRHDVFADCGARASDHGLEACPATIAREADAKTLFTRARSGEPLAVDDADALAGYLLAFVAELNHAKGWVMQLHLGALRNVNAGMYRQLGPDIGCDSISDRPQTAALGHFLGEMSRRDCLPRVVLYNLDPAKNYAFATMCGNFFEAGIPGKVQFGSGWWFLDQHEGMTWQLNALSNLGLLSRFVGMLTDSRSFMSFPRHEYFRRLLCDLLGQDLARGFIPHDEALLGDMIRNICAGNIRRFLGLES